MPNTAAKELGRPDGRSERLLRLEGASKINPVRKKHQEVVGFYKAWIAIGRRRQFGKRLEKTDPLGRL